MAGRSMSMQQPTLVLSEIIIWVKEKRESWKEMYRTYL